MESLDRTAVLGCAGCGNHNKERARIAPPSVGEIGGRAGAVEHDHFRTGCLCRHDEGTTKSGGQPIGLCSATQLDHDLNRGTARQHAGGHLRRSFTHALRWRVDDSSVKR
jgi:hypothetical protein